MTRHNPEKKSFNGVSYKKTGARIRDLKDNPVKKEFTVETTTLPGARFIVPRVIAIDETSNWDLSKCPYKEFIERMEGVYVYDENQHTYCCECSPSYWLVFLEYRPVFKDSVKDQENHKEIVEAIDAWIPHGEFDCDCYVHCKDIAKTVHKVQGEPFRYAELSVIPLESATDYQEAFADVIESCQANPPI